MQLNCYDQLKIIVILSDR